ncbi:hypothetical protein PHET_09227 [Paragonimus heterotremus]|uniref:Uncharacterized protein n=1 Tax=Paragonimus heterotremus TaxID=100268 RepID=A0A8J4SVN8_9TREM|nr:hypothetical protein PHET_09227 [Paragonimus heterotremus]
MSFDLQRLEHKMRSLSNLSSVQPISPSSRSLKSRSTTNGNEQLTQSASAELSNSSRVRTNSQELLHRSTTSLSKIHCSGRASSAPAWYYLFSKPSSYRRHMVAPDILRPLRSLKEQYNDDYETDKQCLAAELDHERKNGDNSFESLSTVSSLLTDRDPVVVETTAQQLPEIFRIDESVGGTTVGATPFVTAQMYV